MKNVCFRHLLISMKDISHLPIALPGQTKLSTKQTLCNLFSFKNIKPYNKQQIPETILALLLQMILMQSAKSVQSRQVSLIIFSNHIDTDKEMVIQNMAIPASSSFALLFICVIIKLSWNYHIRTVCNKALKNGFALQFILTVTNFQQYPSHLRSQMEYCSPLWDGAGQIVLGRLGTLPKWYNKIDK